MPQKEPGQSFHRWELKPVGEQVITAQSVHRSTVLEPLVVAAAVVCLFVHLLSGWNGLGFHFGSVFCLVG